MTVFVDTTALYALLDRTDANQAASERGWRGLLEGNEPLVTSNYVLVEAFALVQHRLGAQAARDVQECLVPVLEVHWVDEAMHRAAISALLTAGRRDLSLVDCSSFELMRQLGIQRALSFDRHFEEQGFERV
jgi:predicted nucleic acid-binding protein